MTEKPFQRLLVLARNFRNAASFAALAILLSCAVPSQAQPLAIHTFAGSPSPGATNGPASSARFNHPLGVAADNLGNIYVADTENNLIRKIAPDGTVTTFAGATGIAGSTDGTGANARFYGPESLTTDAAGTLYVADSANSTIRKITSLGVVTTFAGTRSNFNSFDGSGTNAQFFHPEAVAADLGGNLYVADSWNHTIRKITPAGAVSTLAGMAGNSGAADGTNSKARLNRPAGLAVDSSTNIFVADTFNHTIRKITPAGKVSTIAGLAGVWGSADGTNNLARFYLPQGISAAANGDLFVADSGNQTLRKISTVGTNWVVSTVAGASGLVGNANGIGTNAQFGFPAAIALDSSGSLYVADIANNSLRSTRVVSPLLQFSSTASNLILSWPISANEFLLEQSGTVGPTAAWSLATNGIITTADSFVRTNNFPGTAFYRLRFP